MKRYYTAEAVSCSKGQRNGQVSDADDWSDGTGDQGIMIGYATDETKQMLPMPVALANRIVRELIACRKSNYIADILQAGLVDPRREIIDKAMDNQIELLPQKVAEQRYEIEQRKKKNEKLQKALNKKDLGFKMSQMMRSQRTLSRLIRVPVVTNFSREVFYYFFIFISLFFNCISACGLIYSIHLLEADSSVR
jgi:hypothetical protein